MPKSRDFLPLVLSEIDKERNAIPAPPSVILNKFLQIKKTDSSF